jgi:hypothetical protein
MTSEKKSSSKNKPMIHNYFFILNFSYMVVQLNKIHENDFTISEIEFGTLLKYFHFYYDFLHC